jgi:hypothetical protein
MWILLSLFYLFSSAALAQLPTARWYEFAQVKAWEGTLRIQGAGAGTVATPGTFSTEEWQVLNATTVRIRLEQHPLAPGLGMFAGSVEGSISIVNSRKVSFDLLPCVTDDVLKGAGSPVPVKAGDYGFEMQIETDGEYTLTPRARHLNVSWFRKQVCPPGPNHESTQPFDYDWWPDNAPYRMRLPESGLVLRGSGIYTQNVASLQQIGNIATVDFHIEWELHPAGTQPQEEVIVSVPGLNEWRPEAGPYGGRGNSITLNAKLQKKDGGEPAQKAIKFEWQFVNVSREPGYALNVPSEEPQRDPDLRFEPGDGLILLNEEATRAETPSGSHVQSSATVSSWDWGGFAEAQVTAVMADGRRIVGYLDTDPNQKDIRLPKRLPGDHIAEIWRKQRNVGSLSEAADEENLPLGDGNRGDGLTLYEEYRGFIENGKHIEGNPERKDYFIRNRAGGTYDVGITIFKLESELEVHSDFTESEFPASRIINVNHGDGAHRVDQHGVIIIPGPADQTYGQVVTPNGRNGPPGHIEYVSVPTILPGAPTEAVAYLQATMAHELFHACNVWHHGEDDRDVIWRNHPSGTGYIESERGASTEREVRILYEDGQPYTRQLPAKGVAMVLGVAGGQHSGHDECLMRYDNAAGYRADNDPSLRYKVRENSGLQICATKVGTGVNHFARDPQARYKDAAPGRGDCQHQILVNDGVQAPPR